MLACLSTVDRVSHCLVSVQMWLKACVRVKNVAFILQVTEHLREHRPGWVQVMRCGRRVMMKWSVKCISALFFSVYLCPFVHRSASLSVSSGSVCLLVSPPLSRPLSSDLCLTVLESAIRNQNKPWLVGFGRCTIQFFKTTGFFPESVPHVTSQNNTGTYFFSWVISYSLSNFIKAPLTMNFTVCCYYIFLPPCFLVFSQT